MRVLLRIHFTRIIPDHAETLTDIGILYLKVNDTKNAFDKLFEVTKLNENCGRALIALGAILQVCNYRFLIRINNNTRHSNNEKLKKFDLIDFSFSQKTTLTERSTNTS